MIMRIVLPFLFFIFLFGCTTKEVDDRPPNLIGEEAMTSVLTDVHLIEGARTGLTILGDTASNIANYYNAMYEKHGISKETFEISFAYYTQHPEIMDKMYERVIEELTIIETELKANNPVIHNESDDD